MEEEQPLKFVQQLLNLGLLNSTTVDLDQKREIIAVSV